MSRAAKEIPQLTEKDKSRFWDKVKISSPNDCWIWTSDKVHDGYGTFSLNSRTTRAHRISYAMANGPIAAGLHVCHKCDVRDCVNPSHLFLGDDRVNMRDAAKKGRMSRGSKNTNAKLTEQDVSRIKALLKTEVSQQKIADMFGVCQTVISCISLGKTWGHVV